MVYLLCRKNNKKEQEYKLAPYQYEKPLNYLHYSIVIRGKSRKGMIKMRLWHYALIPVLDNKHLVSQWREVIAIKRQWEKGTLKHRLVSYVQWHDYCYFYTYVMQIVRELKERKINFRNKYAQEIFEFCNHEAITEPYPEHNDRYLKQCLYNLQEKWDRGIISDTEWHKIYDKFKDKM